MLEVRTNKNYSSEPLSTGSVPEEPRGALGLTKLELFAALDALVADGHVVVLMDEHGVDRYCPKALAGGAR